MSTHSGDRGWFGQLPVRENARGAGTQEQQDGIRRLLHREVVNGQKPQSAHLGSKGSKRRGQWVSSEYTAMTTREALGLTKIRPRETLPDRPGQVLGGLGLHDVALDPRGP